MFCRVSCWNSLSWQSANTVITGKWGLFQMKLHLWEVEQYPDITCHDVKWYHHSPTHTDRKWGLVLDKMRWKFYSQHNQPSSHLLSLELLYTSSTSSSQHSALSIEHWGLDINYLKHSKLNTALRNGNVSIRIRMSRLKIVEKTKTMMTFNWIISGPRSNLLVS